MELSSERNNFESSAGGMRRRQAGLHTRPTDAEPTGLFVAVEMTVLVVVAALAMASIIVSGNEMADRESVVPATRQVERVTSRQSQGQAVRATATEPSRGAERIRPADGIASR